VILHDHDLTVQITRSLAPDAPSHVVVTHVPTGASARATARYELDAVLAAKAELAEHLKHLAVGG
jgi:hypothetical protein